MLAPLLVRRRKLVVRSRNKTAGGGYWYREIEIQHRLNAEEDDRDMLEILTMFMQVRGRQSCKT